MKIHANYEIIQMVIYELKKKINKYLNKKIKLIYSYIK